MGQWSLSDRRPVIDEVSFLLAYPGVIRVHSHVLPVLYCGPGA